MVSPYESTMKKSIKKMKKVYFLDLGLRNVIISNFNNIELRSDNGQLFENFVFLEILKHKKSYTSVCFYRTRDGAEIDFILNNMKEKITLEVKYKDLKKPVFYKALQSFNSIEAINKSFVINCSLNASKDNTKYIQSYLTEKIFD